MLVLDEATSSVDTETERQIQAALRKLMEGRTSIVIARRRSTIQHADRIIVLHQGRVVETGSHAQLLAEHGMYRRRYELQYGLQTQSCMTVDHAVTIEEIDVVQLPLSGP